MAIVNGIGNCNLLALAFAEVIKIRARIKGKASAVDGDCTVMVLHECGRDMQGITIFIRIICQHIKGNGAIFTCATGIINSNRIMIDLLHCWAMTGVDVICRRCWWVVGGDFPAHWTTSLSRQLSCHIGINSGCRLCSGPVDFRDGCRYFRFGNCRRFGCTMVNVWDINRQRGGITA